MLRSLRLLFFGLLPLLVLCLPGCGGSGSSSSDPLANQSSTSSSLANQTTNPTSPVTSQDPVFSLDVDTDLWAPTDLSSLPQIDSENGTVLLTAKLLNMTGGVFVDPVTNQKTEAGSPVPNQVVTFNVLAGPGTISYATPLTDKNGEAKAILSTGYVASTTNVIVEATVTVSGKNYRGYTSFQVVRGTGVIMFTSAAATKPGEQNSMLPPIEKKVDPAATPAVAFVQLIPFKLTDANGNPRTGVPVTLSVYSTNGAPTDVDIDRQTVTTDSAGMGIFNVSVALESPPPNSFTTTSVIFRAVTNDANPVTGYVGGSYSLTATPPPLTIAPSSAVFGTDTEVALTVGGGVGPFTVSSSSPARVTAALQPDGVSIVARLVDSSQWTGTVSVSVTDSAGQSATATLSR